MQMTEEKQTTDNTQMISMLRASPDIYSRAWAVEKE